MSIAKIKFRNKEIKVYNNRTVCKLEAFIPYSGLPQLRPLASFPKAVTSWMLEGRSPNIPKLQISWKGITLQVVGKAVKSEEDYFVSSIGEKLAESRAKATVFCFCNTLFRKLLAINTKEFKTFEEMAQKSNANAYWEKMYILTVKKKCNDTNTKNT